MGLQQHSHLGRRPMKGCLHHSSRTFQTNCNVLWILQCTIYLPGIHEPYLCQHDSREMAKGLYGWPCIRIASFNQVQRQQWRDEPVRENTHLVLNTLASRLRELSLNCRSWELSISDHKDPVYIYPEYCLYEWMKLSVKGERVPGKSPWWKEGNNLIRTSLGS